MGIQTTCTCGARFLAQDELAGRLVRCPKCGKNFLVRNVAQPAVPPTFQVACPCGRTYQVQLSMAGRPVKCNACHSQFVVPQPPAALRHAAPISSPAPDPLAGMGPLDNLGDLSSFGDPLGGTMPMTNPAPNQAYAYGYGTPATPSRPKKKKRPVNKSTIMAIALGSLTVLAILGIGVAAFTFYPLLIGYQSPEAVWEAYRKAFMTDDWNTAYDTMTPETQDQMVAGLSFLNQLGSSQNAELAEILKKHGVEPAPPPDISSAGGFAAFAKSTEQMKASANSIKDKRAYFVDFMNYYSKKGQEAMEQRGSQEFGKQVRAGMKEALQSATLEDVVIEGDQARGTQTLNVNGRTHDSPIAFRKVNGGWLMHHASLAGSVSG